MVGNLIEENLVEEFADYLGNSYLFIYFVQIINNLISVIKSLFFIGNMFYIFSSEFLIYYSFNTTYEKTISRITQKLLNQNVLYVKIFQEFTLNINLINNDINNDINNEIIKYSNNVPYCIDDIDYHTFYKILEKYKLNYDTLEPSHSGMISIYFKLKNDNNIFFILKLKKKNAEYNLNECIERINFLLYLLSFLPYTNTSEFLFIINKNIHIFKEQLDFKREVNNIIQNNTKNDTENNEGKIKEECIMNTFMKIQKVYQEVTENCDNAILIEVDSNKVAF